MKRLRVLYLSEPRQFKPWGEDVVAAVGERHDLTILDPQAPLEPQFSGIDVVVDHGGSIGTPEMMDAATDAQLWQIVGTGFDHFPLSHIESLGIPVSNCPGTFSAVALGESAMMFILMLAHGYGSGFERFSRGELYERVGRELQGAVLGILGFGASGQELARRANAFGMRIQVIDVRDIEADILEEIRPEFLGTPDNLDRVVSESDYLSLHLHLNPETRHMIDARWISLMKPSACLINVARGALVDEAALHEALIEGRIGGAGLDVFESEPPDPTQPVFQLPNVVVMPHTAGCTRETSRRRAECVAENVDRIAQGLESLYRIDSGTGHADG